MPRLSMKLVTTNNVAIRAPSRANFQQAVNLFAIMPAICDQAATAILRSDISYRPYFP